MATYEYQSNDGRTITIEPNDDGSFTVSDDEGRSRAYGENVAENIYQDWDLHGVDLTGSGVPPDSEPPEPEPEPEDPNDPGGGVTPNPSIKRDVLKHAPYVKRWARSVSRKLRYFANEPPNQNGERKCRKSRLEMDHILMNSG